ncbi:asparagine synthase (glutamine-hydrolyzing) [Gelidibacter japonicus]|uniref:asparagine synthase (glutamine-hydrolyzing) n=1 Tax=Gelidibacter japonicus TaxID=1962232 RepID=UPI00202168FC|nr:asparagine synthase (glutamine-hydrolyzing) [Gelidibacter japonicus]MCL8006541.1 asparagine synthase (glutamine-hydrolyzing) [Gelidibacter japonicus]
MCGLLGEFTFHNQPITQSDSFETLLALSKHRGPDDSGVIIGSGYQLGFNRLAVLDLSPQGNQPKHSPSGRYQVVFNGEIYNHQDLAQVYALTNLSSTSDTEVLVHLLDSQGVEPTIKHLNGMFAIAIIDTKEDCLYLTRDFAGIKPLFYGLAETGVVMASQFDQVFKHAWFCKTLRLQPEMVKEYFGFGYMQAPNTIYKFIYQVNPGELLRINRQGIVSKKTLVSFNKTQEPEKALTDLSTILRTAVAKQLVSDVPIATFLSGGIDSPLISAYAKKHIIGIEAFTLEVDDPKLNESAISKAYADHLNLKHHIVTVKESDLLSEINAHFKAFSEPFGDYSSIPTYVISEKAKKKHTVMLSGDGGDELFFGYPRMLDVLQKRWWFKLPYVIRRILVQITNKLGLTKTWAPFFRTFDAFITNKHLKIPVTTLSNAFPDISFSKAMNSMYSFDNSNKQELLHQLRWNEFYGHMQRVLVKVDRSSMAHSLEVRVPFLDRNIIEWAWQQKGVLNHKNDLKNDLKVLLAEEIPEILINQNKMGFSVPMNDWLHTELKQDVIKVVFDTPFYGKEVVNVSILREFVEDFFKKKHQNAWGVWHIYAWQKWAIIHTISTNI